MFEFLTEIHPINGDTYSIRTVPLVTPHHITSVHLHNVSTINPACHHT